MPTDAPILVTGAAGRVGAVGRDVVEVFVNISQMTVSQMSLTETTESPQQRQHSLGEQVLNWSGLPVVHIRAPVFLQNDRLTHDVEAITGRPARSVRDYVANHPELFGPNRLSTNVSGAG